VPTYQYRYGLETGEWSGWQVCEGFPSQIKVVHEIRTRMSSLPPMPGGRKLVELAHYQTVKDWEGVYEERVSVLKARDHNKDPDRWGLLNHTEGEGWFFQRVPQGWSPISGSPLKKLFLP